MSFRVRADRSGREPLERVELLDGRGRTLSRMTLVVRRVFLAGRPVRAAGVGGVYTEKRWRGKGFMTRVMLAGLERCRARRFPLSVLFGIPDFYDRFGFATVMFREPDLRLSPGRRPRRGLDLRVRPLRRTDRGKLLAVYRDCVAGRTGACARGASWPGFAPRGWRRVDRAVIAGRAGRAAGYAAVKIEKEAVHLLEVEGRTPQAREALVAWALRLAERLGREYVSVHVMPGHPAGELLRRLGGEVHLAAQRAGGPMARVVDQGRLLEALAPGLAARLGAAGMRPPRGGLAVRTDLGAHTIRPGRGGLAVVAGAARGAALLALDQSRLAQLAFGYRTAEELVAAGEASASGRARGALAAMFLRQEGHMSWADHF